MTSLRRSPVPALFLALAVQLLAVCVSHNATAEPPTVSEKQRTPGPYSLQVRLVVQVFDVQKAADALVQKAKSVRGYFASRDDQKVVLKIPLSRCDDAALHAESLGLVVSRARDAADVASELSALRARLDALHTTLARYDAVLGQAAPANVVAVEREMTSLVEAIESVQGQIRTREHRQTWCDLTVAFRFPDRRPPARDGSSSFAWLNRVNLADLLDDFSQGRNP